MTLGGIREQNNPLNARLPPGTGVDWTHLYSTS